MYPKIPLNQIKKFHVQINALQLQKQLIESLLNDLYLQNESRRQTWLLHKDNLRFMI